MFMQKFRVVWKRCPLAYLGWDFTHLRFVPQIPKGKIVHSSLFGSFGLAIDDENDQDMNECIDDLPTSENKDVEIITASKYDYNKSHTKVSPSSWTRYTQFEAWRPWGRAADQSADRNLGMYFRLPGWLHFEQSVLNLYNLEKSVYPHVAPERDGSVGVGKTR